MIWTCELRLERLFREDLRDLTRVQDIDQLISLSRLLVAQSGQLANFSTLAKQISVTVDTIRRWLDVLESFYFCHRIRPWFKNVSESLQRWANPCACLCAPCSRSYLEPAASKPRLVR
jgi:predicted AAA+ superfamily ATPase